MPKTAREPTAFGVYRFHIDVLAEAAQLSQLGSGNMLQEQDHAVVIDSHNAIDPCWFACCFCEDLQSPTASAEPSQLPKPNAKAEQLTLEATGALMAPQDMYERVVSELSAIRATYPAVTNILAMPSWVPHDVLLGFDAARAMAVEESRYTAWDALNALWRYTDRHAQVQEPGGCSPEVC